jgi:hypothetical protein
MNMSTSAVHPFGQWPTAIARERVVRTGETLPNEQTPDLVVGPAVRSHDAGGIAAAVDLLVRLRAEQRAGGQETGHSALSAVATEFRGRIEALRPIADNAGKVRESRLQAYLQTVLNAKKFAKTTGDNDPLVLADDGLRVNARRST